MFNLLSLVSWGFSSKKPSSNLELVSVQAEEEDHRTDQSLKDATDSSNCNGGNNNNVNGNENGQVVLYPDTSKDPEVTWALQVLDNLIVLAKQCHTVSKNPNFETEAATVSPAKCKELQVEGSQQQQQQQQQLGFKLLASPTCKTYTELPTLIMVPQHSPDGGVHEVRFADELYSLDDTDVELSPVEGDDDDEAFGYGSFAALKSKTDAGVVDRVTGGEQQEEGINEAWLTSLELPELETVFSESESSSDEDEGRLRHNRPLGQIVEEPETIVEDDDEEQEKNSRPPDGGFSEMGSQPNEVMQGTQWIGQGEKSIKSPVALTSTTIRRVVDHEQAADINQTLQIQPLLPNLQEDNGRRKGSSTFDLLAPKVTVLDFQEEEEEEDEPSFRLWECESSSSPSRRRSSQSVSNDFQDPQYLQAAAGLGGGSSAILESQKPPKGSRGSSFVWEEENNHNSPKGYSSFDEIKREFEQFPPQSVRELEHRHRSLKDCSEEEAEEEEEGEGEGKEEEFSYPSPSSFTYERSPTTSVVSDEQPPGQLAGSNSSSLFFQTGSGGAERFNPDLDAPRTVAFMYRESPASVLSQEPDEMPNSMMSDDSSEPRNHQRPCSSTFIYRDESSDLESILEGFGINREEDEEGHVEDSRPFELYRPRKKKADAGRTKTSVSVSELEKPFFSRFTYTAKAMLETSSEEDPFERNERSWLLRDTDLNSTPNSTPKSTPKSPPKSPLYNSPVSSAVPESSSDEKWEEDDHKDVSHVVFEELRYFQEAEKWEPWLGKDDGDGVLDHTDLEFLFPPNFKYKDSLSSQEALDEIFNDTTDSSRQSIPQQQHQHQHQHQQEATTTSSTSTTTRKLDRHGHWVPYVTGRAIDESLGLDSPKGGSKRHTIPQVFSHISKGIEKLANHGSKRHTNSSPPDPSKVKSKDEDDNIFPSVKSWEVAGDEESGPRITSSSSKKSSRRWRHPQQSSTAAATQQQPEKLASSRKFSSQARSASFVPSVSKRSRGVAHIAPCTGRLFSWPQRMRSFSNFQQKSRFMDSDDEGPIGERSFGMSARRDAQQMKRILKGSQKKYAEFSADDILKQDFG